MARNPSDVYSKLPGSVAVTGAVVDSSDYNDQIDDIVNALNDVTMRSGSKAFTGDQSMGSHKLTSVTDGAAAQDAATVKQVQNGVVQHSTAVAGTADAIQVTFVPASTSLTTNEVIRWKSGGANTIVAPTISKDAGSTNKTIKKGASAALAVGDTGASGYECEAIYNGTDWILQNPAVPITAFTSSVSLTSTDAGATVAPLLTLDRFSASPANSDVLGGVAFVGRDSGAGTQTYAQIQSTITDVTAASEDATLDVHTAVAGTVAARVHVGAGLYTDGVTGGDPGAGKVNAAELQKAGVTISGILVTVQNPYAVGATASVTHGVASPIRAEFYLECLTTDLGYSVGDKISYGTLVDGAGNNLKPTSGWNATNVFTVNPASLVQIPNFSTQSQTAITAARWKVMALVFN